MKKQIILTFMFFLLACSFASAFDTTIRVHTASEQTVTINVMNLESLNTLPSGKFTETADESGEISVVYSGPEPSIRLSTYIKDSSEEGSSGLHIFKKDFNGNDIWAGGEVYVDLTLDEPVAVATYPEIEEASAGITGTADETEPVENITEEVIDEKTEDAGLTGKVVSNLGISNSTIIYLIVGFVVAGGVILFFVFRKSFSTLHEPKVTKLSEMKIQTEEGRLSIAEERLKKAEEDLRDAQREISTIKNNKLALSQAEQEFQRARARLDSLKSGGNNSLGFNGNNSFGAGGNNPPRNNP